MATGSYDANGIWNYGEDDNIALFSDTLNKLADSTSDAFTSDRSRLSTLEAGSLAGLIPVKPTSVVVATGTASVSDVGLVSFTGATSLSLNNVFTANYRRYRIMYTYDTSVNTGISMRYRTAGADNSAVAYWRNYLGGAGSSPFGGAYGSAATSQSIDTLDVTNLFAGHMDIHNPYLSSENTRATIQVNAMVSSTGALRSTIWNTIFTSLVQFDGFTLYPGSGTFTGNIQVFGYND